MRSAPAEVMELPMAATSITCWRRGRGHQSYACSTKLMRGAAEECHVAFAMEKISRSPHCRAARNLIDHIA